MSHQSRTWLRDAIGIIVHFMISQGAEEGNS